MEYTRRMYISYKTCYKRQSSLGNFIRGRKKKSRVFLRRTIQKRSSNFIMKRFVPLVFLFVVVIIFFFPVFLGKLPIPADTIVGLYNPFRDYYAKQYPRGVPFKNFLITDPVRQQYPWRNLVIDTYRKFQI